MVTETPDTIDETPIATPSSASVPLGSFTIWDHAAEEATPRIVEVIISSDHSKPRCHTSSPAVLSICRDSRKAALKVFEKQDILYFNTDIESGKRLLTSAKQLDLIAKCRCLALNRICFYGAVLALDGYRRFREFRNIEELIVVIDKDAIGGQPPERTSAHFAIAEAGCDKKYEKMGDHLAYALWKLPHIQRGILVEEVEACELVVNPKEQEVPGSVYRQPATTRIGLLTKGSTAELCASSSIGGEIIEIELARLHRFFAEFAKTSMLEELGLETLERRFQSLTGHSFPTHQ
ncbi:hypothetical protein N431DRAFT_540835 [Stipitochalara longipes BDJ]|nr:hypothetical protein N431DRAFT_540835 [Stipitochalara longipes BDJ]